MKHPENRNTPKAQRCLAALHTWPRGGRFVALVILLATGTIGTAAGEGDRLAGNGVMVARSGVILTTRAVAEQCDRFAIRSSDDLGAAGNRVSADLVASSERYNLALFRVELDNPAPAAPILVTESMHVVVPAPDTRIAHGGFIETDGARGRRLQPAFGYVRAMPDALPRDDQPPQTSLVEADARPGAGLFDMDGNLVGLVLEGATDRTTQRLVDAEQWPKNSYGPPTFFHDLNAVAAFLSEQEVAFGYQVAGKSRRLPEDDLIHGWVAKVTYEISCR